MPKTSLHKERYGSWSGDPNGFPPDYSLCCEQVRDSRVWGSYQCRRKCGHGPEGAYCKQHDPEKVAVRQAKQNEAYKEKQKVWAFEANGKRFYEKLKLIAEGHTEPRALAIETIKQSGIKD